MATESKRVAIIGSGCSGLAALWALKSTNHDVHLFEADEVLGGHTNTVPFKHNGKTVNVDTGFIVFNSATYPNFIKFLEAVKVKSAPSEMTFGVSRDHGAFEWAGTSLSSIFAQWTHLVNPWHWRMIFDVVRFNQHALDLLYYADDSGDPTDHNGNPPPKKKRKPDPRTQETVGEYISREGYSAAFRDNYLLPMTAAIWSTSPDKCALQFPIVTLVRFMWNHHLLNTVAARPTWMTIPGGSQQYIDAILADFPREKIHVASPVVSLEDINDKIIVQFEDETEDLFDHVILAVHGDQAHAIISDSGTEEERTILSGFKCSENTAYLHSDLSLMPVRRHAWSSWNYLTKSTPDNANVDTVSLTYNMNILQHIPTSDFGDVLVTLNPLHVPAANTIQGQWAYEHPLYNDAAIAAQKLLPRIQNSRGISYCGAWTKYGFHEDGFSSGLAVATQHLGATLPFEFTDSTFSRGRVPRIGVLDYMVRLVLAVVGEGIAWVELVWWVVCVPWMVWRWLLGGGKVKSA